MGKAEGVGNDPNSSKLMESGRSACFSVRLKRQAEAIQALKCEGMRASI